MRSRPRLQGALVLALALLGAAQAASALPWDRLATLTPEEALLEPLPKTPPSGAVPAVWYALRLDGGALDIQPVTRTRAARDVLTNATGKPRHPAPTVQTLALPKDAWMAVRWRGDGNDIWLPRLAGRHANALPATALLTAQWTQRLRLAQADGTAQDWELFTDVERRPDGQLLAGSLQLMARRGDSAEPIVLLPPAHGMAFQRQELLWAGLLPEDREPSFVLKRTWLTGEEEHVVVINGLQAIERRDADAPWQLFSSGVDDTDNGGRRPAGQTLPLPTSLNETGQISFDANAWNLALEEAQRRPLEPRRIAQNQTTLDGEPLQVWVDYLPRSSKAMAAADRKGSSATDLGWRGQMVMRAKFRGHTSVLIELDTLEDPLHLSVGLALGQTPAISMQHDPHYNNSFHRWWIWDDKAGRFKRWLIKHSQGC